MANVVKIYMRTFALLNGENKYFLIKWHSYVELYNSIKCSIYLLICVMKNRWTFLWCLEEENYFLLLFGWPERNIILAVWLVVVVIVRVKFTSILNNSCFSISSYNNVKKMMKEIKSSLGFVDHCGSFCCCDKISTI